jgi:hypothetical protein
MTNLPFSIKAVPAEANILSKFLKKAASDKCKLEIVLERPNSWFSAVQIIYLALL